MAEVPISVTLGSGADTRATSGKIAVRRVNRGVDGEILVLDAWKEYALGTEPLVLSVTAGEMYASREIEPRGDEVRYWVAPNVATNYADLEDVIPVFPAAGILGDDLVTGLAENTDSEFRGVLTELFNASTPGSTADSATAANLLGGTLSQTALGTEIARSGSPAEGAVAAKITTATDPLAPKASPYFTGRGRMNRANFGFYDQPANDLRVPFGAAHIIDGAAAGDNDFVGYLFQPIFTGSWASAGVGTAPDPRWGFGHNFFAATGQTSGDGEGGTFWSALAEFDVRSDANFHQVAGLIGEAAFYTASGTGHIEEMISVKSASPKRKGGATGSADHVYSHYINGVNAGPQTSLLGAQALSASTINVVTTRDFPTSGTFKVGDPFRGVPVQTITYTGKTVTSFTGCTGGNGTTVADGIAVGTGTGELNSFKTYSLFVDKGRSFFGGAMTIHGEFGQDASRPVLRVRAVASHSGDVLAVVTATTDARLFHVGSDGVGAFSNSMVAGEGLSYQTVVGLAGPSNESGVKFGSSGDAALFRQAAHILAVGATDAFRLGRFTTAGRPSAATVGAGGCVYDTTLGIPIYSNGTAWTNSTGATV